MNNACKDGYLELILGPMFSGKTTRLIQHYKAYKFIDKKIAVINYALDTRYSDNMLCSHDLIKVPCVFSLTLDEHLWIDADVVLINEGQFFQDIVPVVKNMVETFGKHVYVCGLDGDFRREKFGAMLELIPLCDRVEKLSSFCSICKNGTLAVFSYRLSNDQMQVVIGSNNYMPLCRCCYRKMQLE